MNNANNNTERAIGMLIVYDITNRASFENISKWLEEVRVHVSDKVALGLIGNKCEVEGIMLLCK